MWIDANPTTSKQGLTVSRFFPRFVFFASSHAVSCPLAPSGIAIPRGSVLAHVVLGLPSLVVPCSLMVLGLPSVAMNSDGSSSCVYHYYKIYFAWRYPFFIGGTPPDRLRCFEPGHPPKCPPQLTLIEAVGLR